MAESSNDWLVALHFTFYWIICFVGPFIFVVLSAVLYSTTFWFLPVVYALWYFYDSGSEDQGGRKWMWYKTRWNTACAKHFPVKLIKTCDLNPEKNYIMGCHPHGQFFIGPITAFAFDGVDFESVFPNIAPRLFVHSIFFYLPLARELALACGILAASKKSLEFMLRNSPKGVACAFSIGGAREGMEECTDHIALILKKRKGFVKMAIKHGADMVPSFTFGENLLYRQIRAPNNSVFTWLPQWLRSKSLSMSLLSQLRAVLFGKYGVVPHRVPLTIVVGRPIHVTRKDDPTMEEIDSIHGQYVNALRDLYETYNPIYGNSNVPLVIK